MSIIGVGVWLKIASGLFMLPTQYHFQRNTDFLLFCTVGSSVGDFDYNTITAQLKLGLGLSLAIQAKEFYVLLNGKITTGETPEDIHLMDFKRGITQDELFQFLIYFISWKCLGIDFWSLDQGSKTALDLLI